MTATRHTRGSILRETEARAHQPGSPYGRLKAIALDLVDERDRLEQEIRTHTATCSSEREAARVTYRLPDWLGGLPVTEVREIAGTGDDGARAEVRCTYPQGGYFWLIIDRSMLVEVRPPSIDDPVTLPLAIPDPTDQPHPLHVNRSQASGCILSVASYELDIEGAELLARAAWQVAQAARSALDGA